MTTVEITNQVDKTIIDYVERVIGVGKLEEEMSKLATTEVFDLLNKENKGDYIALIDILGDYLFHANQYGYNPRDPSSPEQWIENHYQKIKKIKK